MHTRVVINKTQFFLLRLLFLGLDLLLIAPTCWAATYLYSSFTKRAVVHFQPTLILVLITIWITGAYLFRLYESATVRKTENIYKATLRTSFLLVMVFALYLFYTVGAVDALVFVLLYSVLHLIAFLLNRYFIAFLIPSISLNVSPLKNKVLAISSMGGHWIELLRLMPAFAETYVSFISNKANLRSTVPGHNFYAVPDANRKSKLQLLACTGYVAWFIISIKPDVIITTGAAPGLASIFIGKLLGIKTIWIDSIANAEKLSLSGTIAQSVADKVYTQWADLATPRVTYSGNIF